MAATLPGLVVVATLFHVAAAALSPSEEKLALYTTPLRPDMDFRTWVLADDKCSWRGVDCDAQGYVVKLDMQHLDGSLPASFSAFKRLLELRLEYKALRGDMQLPTAWSSFQNLRSLYVPYMYLTSAGRTNHSQGERELVVYGIESHPDAIISSAAG
mmetsp:Transcript_2518/g.6578  ORF Transcript_2518/g.6578 Transcript_2518/m.6578 type:complete len:157 (-) Transcript_2518:874-1344(-)